jgi:hypothetical protein
MRNFYQYIFTILPFWEDRPDGMLHLLTLHERKRVLQVQYWAIALSVLFSVMGFVLLYLPQYELPHLFTKIIVVLPYFGAVHFPLVATVYGVVLMIAEILLLTLLHLYAVHRIAAITGYLTPSDLAQADKVKTVLDVSLEVKNKAQEELGIDPYQGLSAAVVFGYNLILRLKGLLSSVMLKWVLQRLLGRFAVRELLDFSGLPIYGFLNGYSTYTLLREARVVIMGQHLIERCLARIDFTALATPDFADLLYDTLQFIAINKRDYHNNHYLLTKLLLERCGVQPRNTHRLRADYYTHLKNTTPAVQTFCLLIVHLGFLLDGEISIRERVTLQALTDEGFNVENFTDLQRHLKAFLSGSGMESLLVNYVVIG